MSWRTPTKHDGRDVLFTVLLVLFHLHQWKLQTYLLNSHSESAWFTSSDRIICVNDWHEHVKHLYWISSDKSTQYHNGVDLTGILGGRMAGLPPDGPLVRSTLLRKFSEITQYKSPAVEAKNTFSYIVMQVIWCLKFCNMTKSGGQSPPLQILGGLVPLCDLRPCCIRHKLSFYFT